MFSANRRLIATICIVGFLVVSFGTFTPPAFASACSHWAEWCCDAICITSCVCEEHGSGSHACNSGQKYAGVVCATAADLCNGVYYPCDPCDPCD